MAYSVYLSSHHPLVGRAEWVRCAQKISLAGEETLFVSCFDREGEELRQLLMADGGFSWAAVPQGFKLKAAFFDMDGTLISGESLVELAQSCLSHSLKEEIEAITTQAMQGGLAFVPALRQRMQRFQGRELGELESIAAALKLHRGSEALMDDLKTRGVPCYLVTGGLKVMAVPVAQKLGMAGVCANTPRWVQREVADSKQKQWVLSGELDPPFIDGAAKEAYVREVCGSLGCDLKDALVVGDGANDYSMAASVGMAVGFAPKKVLLPALNAAHYSGSHLWLQQLFKHFFAHRP